MKIELVPVQYPARKPNGRGAFVRYARCFQRKTLGEVARAMGLTVVRLSEIERGRAEMTEEEKSKFERILNVLFM